MVQEPVSFVLAHCLSCVLPEASPRPRGASGVPLAALEWVTSLLPPGPNRPPAALGAEHASRTDCAAREAPWGTGPLPPWAGVRKDPLKGLVLRDVRGEGSRTWGFALGGVRSGRGREAQGTVRKDAPQALGKGAAVSWWCAPEPARGPSHPHFSSSSSLLAGQSRNETPSKARQKCYAGPGQRRHRLTGIKTAWPLLGQDSRAPWPWRV